MAEITHYSIRMYGGPDGSEAGIRAQIYLFGKGNTLDGLLQFWAEGFELPPSKKELFITLNFNDSTLGAVIDMLRNESPIFLIWQEALQNGWIGTHQEPTGEGE